ncbi:MAG: hypothetical protein Q4E09_06640 [Eubacteriales bacterium]|nr:hypothetical protein [Eubacteriales bacterium]
MKNFKKLFIALPLVLVMLFAALPVFAELQADTFKLVTPTLNVDLKIGTNVDHAYLNEKTRQVPVWAAEVVTYAENKGKLFSYGAGWINLLNDGFPAGWVEANPDAVAPLQIGQYAVENLDFFKDNGYFLPTYNINHVEKVNTNITVPASWTEDYEAAKTWIVAEAAGEKFVKNNSYPKDDVEDYLNADKNAVTYKGQTVAVSMIKETATDKVAVEKGTDDNATKYKPSKAVAGLKVDVFNEKDLVINALQGAGYVFKGEDANKPAGDWEKTTETTKYVFSETIYELPEGMDVTDLIDGDVTADLNGKYTASVDASVKNTIPNVKVTKGTAPDHLVDAKLSGLLVIVEKKYVPVTVKHHYMVADGEQIVKETKENQDKNVVLTPNNILQSWLKPVGGYVYDPAQTKVEAVKEDKTLINGEVFVTGYVVDLFYTAAEEEASDIESAFANTTAGVANQQNVANLPATGAASNVAVILSSVALVVVGLFLKK